MIRMGWQCESVATSYFLCIYLCQIYMQGGQKVG